MPSLAPGDLLSLDGSEQDNYDYMVHVVISVHDDGSVLAIKTNIFTDEYMESTLGNCAADLDKIGTTIDTSSPIIVTAYEASEIRLYILPNDIEICQGKHYPFHEIEQLRTLTIFDQIYILARPRPSCSTFCGAETT